MIATVINYAKEFTENYFSGVTQISRNSTWKSLRSLQLPIPQNNSWGVNFLVISNFAVAASKKFT